MKLKSTLLAAAALSALAATSQAQMAANSPMPSDAVPVVPGMAPGTTPGFVRVDPAVTPNPAPGVPRRPDDDADADHHPNDARHADARDANDGAWHDG